MASSNDDGSDSEYVHPRGVPHFPGHERRSNTLPIWGNERTMNLNPLILTNIQTSHYFKSMFTFLLKLQVLEVKLCCFAANLSELKTYHEVVDEIYYKVQHLEPWEKGSRKTSGQTGMCGGVSARCLTFSVSIIPTFVYFRFVELELEESSPLPTAYCTSFSHWNWPGSNLSDWSLTVIPLTFEVWASCTSGSLFLLCFRDNLLTDSAY